MPDSYERALTDVDMFLARYRPDYERFLDVVFREIGEYRDMRRNSSPIYRIYTRADKQIGGEKLKSRLGIAKKLAEWRDGAPDNERISVAKIHDIIGITVVTFFESEVEQVVSALRRARFRNFTVLEDNDIARPDYNANHVIVRQNSKGLAYGGTLCEIQIKSLLHDSWSTRTHDIYKDRTRNPKIGKRVASLTRLVKSLEEQSDLLREDLETQSADDGIRRDAAAINLLFQLTQMASDQQDDGNASLAREILENRDYFSDCTTDDVALVQALNRWQKARDSSRDHQTACRFMAVLALLRTGRDFDNDAIGAIDAWLDVTQTSAERAKALSLRALTNWALGNLEGAVESARELVVHAQGMKTTTAKWNLAYYLAEQSYANREPSLHSAELEDLTNAECSGEDDRQSMSFRDTLGAIKIMTATNSLQVFEGQRLCEEAWKWSTSSLQDIETFQLFYELHVSRAVKRLNSL